MAANAYLDHADKGPNNFQWSIQKRSSGTAQRRTRVGLSQGQLGVRTGSDAEGAATRLVDAFKTMDSHEHLGPYGAQAPQGKRADVYDQVVLSFAKGKGQRSALRTPPTTIGTDKHVSGQALYRDISASNS